MQTGFRPAPFNGEQIHIGYPLRQSITFIESKVGPHNEYSGSQGQSAYQLMT
jgi:hypothetical protein